VSSNKLIAAGNSRLKKAADSTVDPAVPAELQKRAAVSAVEHGSTDGQEPSVFARGRVLSADDITGTPEEQLAYITERLHEIDLAGKRAEDFTVLNKAVLLEVAQERELHLVAGHTNFAVWAAGVLDIEPKYVFELLQDAARIRAISELGPDLAQHLTRASARKVMAEVITSQGLETAQVVMTQGLAQAVEQGKKRPTASLLASIAKDLTTPSIPAQESRSEISDLPAAPSVPAVIAALERAATSLKERVYSPLAPAAVQAALEVDPAATREHLERLESEMQRVVKRLAAANRSAAAASEQTEAPAG
jgi:transcriptional regulator with XRE-family HTH domain